MSIAEETLDRIESLDLASLGRADIDDVIEYVHVPTARLPGYRASYDRYLRQRWNVNDLDFTADKVDWAERMTDDSRNSFLSIASGFHHGERQVAVELAPLLFGVPEDYKIFLTSHLEDEARHTVFFDRFYREVVGPGGRRHHGHPGRLVAVHPGDVRRAVRAARLPDRRPAPGPLQQAPADEVRDHAT